MKVLFVCVKNSSRSPMAESLVKMSAKRGVKDCDFLTGLDPRAANCNAEVLRDTLTFLPGELVQAAGRPASRQYTGPKSNERCGSPPESKVNFMVRQLGFDGLVSPDF